MKKFHDFLPVLFLLFAGVATIARGQATTARVAGKVTLTGNPLSDAQVLLISPESGKTYKVKTDKKGEFQLIGVQIGNYEVAINTKNGECLYKTTTSINMGETATEFNELTVNINDPGEGCGKTAPGTKRDHTGDNVRKRDAGGNQERAKNDAANTQLARAREAISQQNWPAAESALQEVLKSEPDHWELYVALGGAQANQGKHQEAVQTYDTGIEKAEKTQPDPKNPYSDPSKVKTGISQMLMQEGSLYLKLEKPEDAAKAYTKAAESGSNPGTAYYNVCAIYYTMRHTEDALKACEKAIAADGNKADAYFLKGSILTAAGRLDSSGKRYVTAAAVEALKKYLTLAPDGPHAAEAKQMLESSVIGN